METQNIIAVNVPNMISITLMAIVGALILGAAKKAYMSATSQS